MPGKNEKRLTVHVNQEPVYDIVLTDSFERLPDELTALGCGSKKVCIITDSNVAPLYLEPIRTMLETCCRTVHSFVFEAGEEQKNLETVQTIYEYLVKHQFDRKDCLIALGGGVVGDLCGFAAATYLRGIGFIQVPTTLLSQVDSSIGGKTGVDFNSYKNMVGAFHMPKLVYTNVSVLLTLPEEQFSNGMGEVIKHGLIRDRNYYEWILQNRELIKKRKTNICRELVYGSNLVKREVVEIDPMEQNERATLNFGHTLGHAVEKQMNFQMLHGHSVALGVLAALKICERRNLISCDEIDRYRDIMEYFCMPMHVYGCSRSEIIAATKNDKKMEAGVIKFILLDAIGHAFIDRTVTEKEMEEALMMIMD